MKRQVLVTFLFFHVSLLNCMAQSNLHSGSCGSGLTWSYSEATKTLTISGAGDMTNYERGSSYKHTPWYDFRYDIQNVILGSEVYSIGDCAFEDMPITSIAIPNSVARIGKWAFSSTKLTSVTIPPGIKTLEEHTFNGCRSLSEVSLANTLTSIGKQAFYRCTSLKSIEIPDKVTSIGEFAFWNCRSLTSVTIPNSVISIGYNAFDGGDEYTPNINTIISYIDNPFQIEGRTSYNEKNHYCGVFSRKTFSNAILYVPKGTIDKYKSTEGWKDFANIKENTQDNPINTDAIVNGIKYIITSNSECEVVQIEDYSGDIVIPEKINIEGKEYEVTSIAKGAFIKTENVQNTGSDITSVYIPNSVKHIGRDAFFGCI